MSLLTLFYSRLLSWIAAGEGWNHGQAAVTYSVSSLHNFLYSFLKLLSKVQVVTGPIGFNSMRAQYQCPDIFSQPFPYSFGNPLPHNSTTACLCLGLLHTWQQEESNMKFWRKESIVDGSVHLCLMSVGSLSLYIYINFLCVPTLKIVSFTKSGDRLGPVFRQ